MIAARKRVGPRPARQIQRWFLLGSLVLAVSAWLPLTAQTLPEAVPSGPSTPGTVVLPPLVMHMPLVFGEGNRAALCPLSSANSYESTSILNSPRNPVPPPHLDPDLNLAMRGYRLT